MGKTHWWAVVLMFITTIFTSTAQVFYKTAAPRLPDILTNWPLLIGLFLYAIGAVLFTLSLKGGDVSVLYPLLATSYLWVTIAAYVYYGEQIGVLRIVGVGVIMIGISVMGFASKNTEVPA